MTSIAVGVLNGLAVAATAALGSAVRAVPVTVSTGLAEWTGRPGGTPGLWDALALADRQMASKAAAAPSVSFGPGRRGRCPGHRRRVAIGGGWTRAMDYRTPQAVSAADGAAAAVVGMAAPGRLPIWRLIDTEVIAQEQNFGDMFLIGDRRLVPPEPGVGNASDPDPETEDWTGPYYHVTASGLKHFSTFGGQIALLAASRLLQRQGIPATDVTLTGHQASQTLVDIWQQTLKPGATFFTLAELANMTVANIPVNLSLMRGKVSTPWVVALGLAGDMHAHAMLLRAPEQR